MPEEKCRAIQRKLDITPSDEKKFMLWSLLKEYISECCDYEKANEGKDSAEVAKDARLKAEYLETLICYEIW